MPVDKDLLEALEALARSEGKSGTEVLKELISDKVRSKLGREEEPEPARLARVDTGDASGARRKAIERHHAQEFPGSPVVRYQKDPYNETAAEARERWLEEETELDDGVHGLGGQTAGGIFGDGAIATDTYDPMAMSRAERRAETSATARLANILERIEQRMGGGEPAAKLPGARHPALGRGRR